MAASATALEYVQKMFLAYFGRPVAPTGQEYYGQLVDAGNVAALQDDFWNSAESTAQFGSLTTEGKVNAIFQQLFGRDAATAGLTYWTLEINAGRVSLPSAALTILNSAADADLDTFNAKLQVAEAFTSELDTTPEILAYQNNIDGGRAVVTAVTTQAEADAAVAGIEATVAGVVAGGSENSGQIFTLTNDTDVATANVFIAGQVYTPGGNDRINSLQDEDTLTGMGVDSKLNATLGNAGDNGGTTITPKLTAIETINVAFSGSGATAVNELDLQDSTGVTKAINITRVSDGVGLATIDNIGAIPTDLSVSNSGQPNQSIFFAFKAAAVAGATDAVKLTVSDVQVAAVAVQDRSGTAGSGIETINLVSTGNDNTIGQFFAEDVETLNISGDKSLTLGTTAATTNAGLVEATRVGAGLANVAGSLSKVDASEMTGDLTYVIGNEINAGKDGTSGQSINLSVIGGKGDDTFMLAAGASVDAADSIDGGEGTNNLLTMYGGTSTITGVANIKGVSDLAVRTGHDAGTAADAVTINADAFATLTNTYIRNEGQDLVLGSWVSQAEGSAVTLSNYTDAQAKAITVAHGTTGNSTIANNNVAVNFKTAGTANAAQVTIVDGANVNPVFNLNLTVASGELVTLVDNDTESNTVHLNQGTYTAAGSTITLQGGAAGQYMNLDSSANGVVPLPSVVRTPFYDYAATAGYGYVKDGSMDDNTNFLTTESAQQVAGGGVATRDAAASTVFYGTAGAAGDGVTRHVVENIAAGGYAGDVVVRVGDVTRADGVTSQKITTGVGNDTVIFDAIGVTNAGFTSGDTVAMGAGTDTMVIDGNTATIPGTPRIDIQTSEWDNVTGVDVLRFGNNAGVANTGVQVANAGGAYYARIDNDFVTQTDAGNRLTVINNDGDLSNNSESDLVLDLRGLSQSKFVTFVGANANGAAGISSNRIVVDDISANQNMVLNGGDTDVRVNTTPGYIAGNNNVYEVSNTANVSISDLAQTSNFGLINFTNDQATAQTLTLTLNNTIVEALVDSSKAATSAATQEVLTVVATDNGGIASALNIDARQVTGFHSLNVTGSGVGNDVLTLNSNVGGAVNTVALGVVSTGDRVNWTGGSAGTTVTINQFANTHQFVDGAVTTTHSIASAEIVDLTGLSYASSITNALVGNTVVLGTGVDTVQIDTAALTGVGTAAAIRAEAVTIQNFAGLAAVGGDVLKLGVVEGVTANAAATTFAGAADIAAVSAAFIATVGGNDIAYINEGASGNVYVFADLDGDDALTAGDAMVVLVGVGTGVAGSAIAFNADDIIA